MNRAALTLGLVLALLGAIVFVLYVRSFDDERSGGEAVMVVAAKKPIPRGKTVTDDMLTVQSIPLAYVEERCVKAAEQEKILGLRIVNPLEPGAALMWSDVADRSDDQRDLSSLVAPGYRAVYLKSVREDQGSALIRPGDFVDVIATLGESNEARGSKSAVVLLQRVLVLANGVRTSAEPILLDPDDKHPKNTVRDQGLTLSLSLQQAQTMAAAVTRGHLSVALRSPEDERTQSIMPPITMAAVADAKIRAAIDLGQYDPALPTAPRQPDEGP